MSGRRAFTLVEAVVAVSLGTLLLILAYNAIILLTKSERSIDRDSQRAITESTMMQALLMDVRSSFKEIQPAGTETYKITRLMPTRGGGPLVEKVVTWQVHKEKQTITRTVEGEPSQQYVFAGLADPRTTFVKLKLERVADGQFTP